MMQFARILTLATVLLGPTAAFALAPTWKIEPDKSSLTFIATQNSAPVKGSFKKFTGEINFDPNQLDDSKVKIVIDMNSVSTSYVDLTTTLITSDWFNIKIFPEAVFEASKFVKTGENAYKADGTLTIRDKSLPVVLIFTADQPTEKSATVKGYAELKRLAFGVGQGEWSSTDEIKDIVRVDFTVSAVKVP